MATSAADAPDTLTWEAEQRPRAGAAAIASGLLLLVGGILQTIAYRDVPTAHALDAVRDAAGQPVPGGGLRTPEILYLHDHAASLIASGVLLALAAALIAPVLGLLYRATQVRRPEVPRAGLYAALIGPVLLAVANLVFFVALALKAGDFAGDTVRTTAAAHDALGGGVPLAAQALQSIARLILAVAFVVVALNAMRVGLLTRFMGVLGIIVGVLSVLGGQINQAIVEVFWLVALGVLLLGRWSTPLPAWETGEAVPWPTQQELREAREREARGEMTGPATVPDKPAHPSSKKKKRKR